MIRKMLIKKILIKKIEDNIYEKKKKFKQVIYNYLK